MRASFLPLAAFTLASFAYGQTAQTGRSERISAIVQIQRDSVGASLVRISVLDPQYPVDILKAQINRIGVNTGSGARGVQITDDAIDPAKPGESRLLRATFAVDGLVDRGGTWVKPGPVIRGLAGAPAPHQLDNVQIDFDFEKPTNVDLADFSSPSVDVGRRMVDRTIEYTVHYKSQDPAKIDVPDFTSAETNGHENSSKSASSGPDWVVIVTVGVAVVAVGALVYCLFLLNPFYRKKYRP